jgi:ATP-dependent RNA helicase SUPV3L1/SUV3
VTTSSSKHHDLQQLDELTGGAFTAPTSGERAARVRTWLASSPSADQLAEVFKELSGRDKGAARLLREKLDDIKRSKGQEAIAQEWATKAQTLLAVPKLNIADALAWQRDAAKVGAPLSKEPLTLLKVQLADRVKIIEDLQHRVQVQREAAVLLAQRIEVLSMKPWRDAQAVWDGLRTDVSHWQDQALALLADGNWPSVDVKFPPLLDASKAQLLVVWDAFQAALAQAVAASSDAAAPLPPVPQWANELRIARGVAVEAPPKPQRPKIDPEIRAQAESAVRDVLAKLELEIAEGHGKASAGAANALRNALKEHGRLVGDKLEHQAQTALSAAGELEGWQRWRADQLREELVAKAEGLLKREPGHELGGRKMQDSLRTLREQWKQTDQGGVPNHALWKRFDEACNQAHKVVEAWLEKVKAESAEHKAQRLTLIEEVKTWAAENPSALDDDWKGFNRILHQFGDRWRDGGHLNEKAFAELQPQWLAAISAAAAPLEALQKLSVELRQAMIEEAKALGSASLLRVDAVKTLQQRWQAEAHAVPLERRFEQKLWDAFRKPIDEAFNRKTAEREKADADLNARDRMVLDAAKALEAANAGGDAQQIRSAMAALEAALRGQALAQSEKAGLTPVLEEKVATMPTGQAQTAINNIASSLPASDSDASAQAANVVESAAETSAEPAPAPTPAHTPVAPRKPVVAMRGDDRPGMKKSEPAVPGRGGKFGDRKDGPRGDRPDRFGGADRGGNGDRGDRGDRPARPGRFDNPDFVRNDAPRLGDTAFRAQRDALERAQFALKKLAAQAHGESIVQWLTAWEKRDAALLPSLQELGNRANAAARNGWAQALAKPASGDAGVALLRLEMAAEQPTPAEHISARRMLQLQLLTRRNDPPPAQTWAQDTATVLASDFQAEPARRVQNVLKVLLKN